MLVYSAHLVTVSECICMSIHLYVHTRWIDQPIVLGLGLLCLCFNFNTCVLFHTMEVACLLHVNMRTILNSSLLIICHEDYNLGLWDECITVGCLSYVLFVALMQ